MTRTGAYTLPQVMYKSFRAKVIQARGAPFGPFSAGARGTSGDLPGLVGAARRHRGALRTPHVLADPGDPAGPAPARVLVAVPAEECPRGGPPFLYGKTV